MSALKEKTGYLFENVWTVPNLLSFIRILLVPVFAVLFMKGYYIWSVAVLALSGLSDFFDGKIARRFNQVSELGKMLDPIADKLTQATIAVVLFITFLHAESPSLHAFAWVFLLFIAKELFMLIGGALMIAFGIKPGAAEIFGKAATMVFYIIMIGITVFHSMFPQCVKAKSGICISVRLLNSEKSIRLHTPVRVKTTAIA